MLRKERILEALRVLCVQRPAQNGVLRRNLGFSAEEVADAAKVDRTNASRDLNLLAQEGKIERIPGRPVLFAIRLSTTEQANVGRKQAHAPTNGQHHTQANAIIAPHAYRDAQDVIEPVADIRQDSLPLGVVMPRAGTRGPAVAASVQVGAIVTNFETLIGGSAGLKVAVQQAKAAMLYPPHGLHTLLSGPSGVGKTTFARLMHVFAQEHHALPDDAPFISFNCADYAGNPQLLMAHLFGVVRGAFTGADRERAGLVEQAHRGILFLDEVHRLPPEGQEMLFHLMDRERFRRLGDVVERHASLLLLAATTEDPNSTLLPTFRRRIPMTILLPGLHERSVMERYELLRAFFTTECSGIGANIYVTPQALQSFLLYECPGNVGQLRTDVQLACARAYLEYRTNNTSELSIDLDILPDHVRRGLLRTAELHRALEPGQREEDSGKKQDGGKVTALHVPADVLEAMHLFTPTGLSLDSLPESAQDLYTTISYDLNRLRRNGLAEHEITRLLHLDIQRYFQRFADQVTQERPGVASHLVDEHIAAVSRDIVQYAEEQLARVFPSKLALVLAMHLTSLMERIANGQHIDVSLIQSVRRTYPIEYEVARRALLQFRTALAMSLPESETDVLAVLLAHADALLSSEQSTVGIVVAAHGRGIAGGLAELANTLVGGNAVRWVELTLEQSPEQLVEQVANWVRVADQGSGVLLLVDFASLLSLGELVTRQTGVQVRSVSGVSAPLVVEAVRRAQRPRHMTLDQLAASLSTGVMNHAPTDDGLRRGMMNHASAEKRIEQTRHEASKIDAEPVPGTEDGFTLPTPRVILSVCLTGLGSAAKIAELIEERLPGLRQQGVEIVCMDISLAVRHGWTSPGCLDANPTTTEHPPDDREWTLGQRPERDARAQALFASGKTEADVQHLVGDRDVVAIVGTINPHLESYPYIALTDLLFGDGVARLRTLLGKTLIDPALLQPSVAQEDGDKFTSSPPFNTEQSQVYAPLDPTIHRGATATVPIFTQRGDLMREITHTLSEHLMFLNPARAMPLIESMIELIEVEVGETFDIEVLAGLVLHLACIMERGVQHIGIPHDTSGDYSETLRTHVEHQFPHELSICRRALQVLSAQLARAGANPAATMPDEEAYNIVGILRQVDIFIGDTRLL